MKYKRCGPSSVTAIKRGEVMKAFDTSFLYSEVNAHEVNWKWTNGTHPLKLINKRTNRYGSRNLFTLNLVLKNIFFQSF